MAGDLAKAVCQVMAEAQYIQKTGWNNHNRYKYATDADVLTKLQPAMAKAGLALIPHKVETQTVEHGTSGRGNTNWRTELVVTWMLIHTSGESVTVQAPGCGLDQQDKGVYKAMTGALKYALRFLFLVPTGEDAEQPQPPQEAPQRQERPRTPERPPQRQERPATPPAAPDWMLDQLAAAGWIRTTAENDIRDLFAWCGKRHDPWAVGPDRLKMLPVWLEDQVDEVEAWERWNAALDELLEPTRVDRPMLRRWLVANGRHIPERTPREGRERLLAYLRETGQLEQVHAWHTAQQAGGGAA